MGLNDMDMSGFNADAARYDRMNRTQQPEFQPGQGMNAQDIFATSTVPSNNGAMGDIFSTSPTSNGGDIFGQSQVGAQQGMGDIFNNGIGQPSPNGLNINQMQQPNQDMKTDEDKVFEVIAKAGKGSFNFLKDFTKSFSGLTPLFWTRFGFKVTIVSVICIVGGIVGRLFGWGSGLHFAIGGCLSGIVGILSWFLTLENSRNYTSEYKDENNSNQNFSQPVPEDDSFSTGGMDFNQSNSFDSFDNFDNSDFSDLDDFDDYPDEVDDDFSDFDNISVDEEVHEAMSTEDALSQLQVIDKGMYTRQYLYDNFVKVLPHIKSNFSNVVEYEEDDDIFVFWDDIVQRASAITGLKDDEVPYLKQLKENAFTVTAIINRTPKMRPDLIANEIAKAYAYKTYDDDEKRASVFAKYETVLDDCIITVFTGASHMISLKDMYAKCEDFVLDKKNMIPIVLGVNEKGKVICTDFRKIESIIVAGMPRSGKSWLVQAILTQMCALLSPKELIIYILDPKASTSDYKRFCLPHVKKFASKYTDFNGNIVNKDSLGVLDTLRHIVNVEAPRRKKLIGDNGCANINDFREKFPDIDLPYIYIVVDEMVTLSSMEKEDEKEYQSYLDMIVTQFPNLGIRGMFIPHEVKNQIISKTAYDSIKARISVKGSPEHIEASTGTKPRAFPYRLCNVGDMAVNIDTISASTQFVHGVALTDSNEKNNQLFDYLRRVWSKLEPDEVQNSVAKLAENDDINRELLKQVQDDSDSMEVFSNSNELGLSGFDNADALDDLDFFNED